MYKNITLPFLCFELLVLVNFLSGRNNSESAEAKFFKLHTKIEDIQARAMSKNHNSALFGQENNSESAEAKFFKLHTKIEDIQARAMSKNHNSALFNFSVDLRTVKMIG